MVGICKTATVVTMSNLVNFPPEITKHYKFFFQGALKQTKKLMSVAFDTEAETHKFSKYVGEKGVPANNSTNSDLKSGDLFFDVGWFRCCTEKRN